MTAIAVLIAIVLAASIGLTQVRDGALDDAFITYVYSQNLAEGHGLRYNPGDASVTEGSSSLLQVLVGAAGIKLGIDPLTLSRGIGLLVLGFISYIMILSARQVADVSHAVAASSAAVAVCILFGLWETVGHIAGGMETPMVLLLHAALFSWGLSFAVRRAPVSGAFQLGGVALSVLLILVRPEGFLLTFGILAMAFCARLYLARGRRIETHFWEIVPVLAGSALFLALLFVWKIAYFGDIFPTAYWVKSNNAIYGSNGEHLPGLTQVLSFLVLRWVPLSIIAFGVLWTGAGRKLSIVTAMLMLPAFVIALLYSNAIHEVAGGFRYGYPLIAPLFIVLAIGLACHARRYHPRLSVAYLVAVGVILSLGVSPDRLYLRNLKDPKNTIFGWVDHQPELAGLSPLARDLEATGLGDRATVVTSAAGLIPYLSGFHTVDWIGLNDEQLSGKYEMSAEEVRAYIDAQHPDVAMSIFPAASEGIDAYRDDPGFNSNSVRATLNGRGVKLFRYWDQARVRDVIWNQMLWLRDETDLAACYPLKRNWAIFVHVKRNSPHYAELMEHMGASAGEGCDPERIKQIYNITPFAPVQTFKTSSG